MVFLERWWKVLSGGVVTLGAATALFFAFFPGAKPAGPCATQGAQITNLVSTQRVTRRSYFALKHTPTKGISAARLDQPGVLVRFDIHTQGYVHIPLAIASQVLTANAKPLTGPELDNPLQMTVTPQKCDGDEGTEEIWSPLPKQRGSYRVQILLLEPNGDQLQAPWTRLLKVA